MKPLESSINISQQTVTLLGAGVYPSVYWRASNIPAYREATGKLCELHLRARESEAAWREYEDFLNAGGEYVPPTVWLELCRVAEERQDFERAASEYEKTCEDHASKREALLGKDQCRSDFASID